MAGARQQIDSYLESASPRYRSVFEQVGASLRRAFPKVESVFEWRMPGWKVKLREKPPPGWRGTMDGTCLTVLLVERKAGITLHFWNPLDFSRLERDRTALTEAGFKVMRGCLQFNRLTEYPFGAVKALLETVKP